MKGIITVKKAQRLFGSLTYESDAECVSQTAEKLRSEVADELLKAGESSIEKRHKNGGHDWIIQ